MPCLCHQRGSFINKCYLTHTCPCFMALCVRANRLTTINKVPTRRAFAFIAFCSQARLLLYRARANECERQLNPTEIGANLWPNKTRTHTTRSFCWYWSIFLEHPVKSIKLRLFLFGCWAGNYSDGNHSFSWIIRVRRLLFACECVYLAANWKASATRHWFLFQLWHLSGWHSGLLW